MSVADEQYVGGELHDPNRNLPLAIYLSMTTTLFLFIGANTSYFIVMSAQVVGSSNTVALDFGRVIIGRFGAVIFSTLVAISCFGTLINSFYTSALLYRFKEYRADSFLGARLIYAASKDHFLPEIFGRVHPRRRTPDNAMYLKTSLTLFYIVFGGGFRRE
jgi:amino acid transporter